MSQIFSCKAFHGIIQLLFICRVIYEYLIGGYWVLSGCLTKNCIHYTHFQCSMFDFVDLKMCMIVEYSIVLKQWWNFNIFGTLVVHHNIV